VIRAFSILQETDLANYIDAVYIKTNFPLNGPVLRRLAKRKYDALHPYDTRLHKRFKASPAWENSMKKRYQLTSRKPRRRRLVKNPPTDNEVHVFRQALKNRRLELGDNAVLNMDETVTKSVEAMRTVIGVKGTECRPVVINGNDKQGVPAIVTVTASGSKLPTMFVAKGKTDASLKKLRLPQVALDAEGFPIGDGDIPVRTRSGWADHNIIEMWLHYVVLAYMRRTGKHRICIVIDSASCHWYHTVVARAAAYGVELLKVPKGMTSSLQPLDVRINGSVKSGMRSLWMDAVVDDPLVARNVADAVRDFQTKFRETTSETIVSVFNSICDAKSK